MIKCCLFFHNVSCYFGDYTLYIYFNYLFFIQENVTCIGLLSIIYYRNCLTLAVGCSEQSSCFKASSHLLLLPMIYSININSFEHFINTIIVFADLKPKLQIFYYGYQGDYGNIIFQLGYFQLKFNKKKCGNFTKVSLNEFSQTIIVVLLTSPL